MANPRSREPDSGVESGEIVERRSLIIRSQSVPSLVTEEPTERNRLPQKRSRNVAGIACAILAVVIGAAGGALSAFATRTSVDDFTARVDAAAGLIASDLDAQARAALLRAGAIASSSMLRAAIVTDAATLRDMAGSDLVFPTQPGDVLEVLQEKDGASTSLLRIPAAAAALVPAGANGSRIELDGDGLAVVVSVPVPTQDTSITGQIVLRVPLDLGPIRQRVAKLGGEATLEGLAAPVHLVDGVRSRKPTSAPVRPGVDLQAGALAISTFVPSAAVNRTLVTARAVCFCAAGSFLMIAALTVVLRRRKPKAG